MPSLAAGLWETLTAAGGSLALTFIVVLVLGLLALTLFFLGSSVVVLDRFARTARSPLTACLVALLWAVAVGGVAVDTASPELALSSWSERLFAWGQASAGWLIAVLVAMGIVHLLLRWLRGRTLASLCLVVLGLGCGLLAGSTGRLVYATAPALTILFVAMLVAWRRGLRGAEGEPVRLLGLLCAALGVGGVVAALSPASATSLTTAGVALLGVFGGAVLLGLLPLAAVGLLDARGTPEWFIALRYLVAKRRQTFISLITLICVTGVAAGVWLIVVVLSVMNGFERTWREEIIGNRAHFTVHSGMGPFEDYSSVLDTVLTNDRVVAAAPYLDAEGMVRGAGGEIVGIRVRGVDPDRVGDVTDLRDDLVAGSLAALHLAEANDGTPQDPGIVVGSQLANALGVGVGDPLTLISPFGGPPTPFGPAPRLKRFQVVGVFRSSFFQYDEVFTYVNLPAAQDFRRSGDLVQGIEVRATDVYRSAAVASEVEAELGFPYYTRDWKEFFPSFFQALKTERILMFVLLTMIMVVAAFVIVATLIMMIMEKSGDIAILKAMGASDASIERIFAIEGTLIGVVGTAVGLLAGLAVLARLAWLQEQIEAFFDIDTLPASVYQFSTLPWEIDVFQLVIVASIAMVLSLGATLFPSRQGARLDPAEALRYE